MHIDFHIHHHSSIYFLRDHYVYPFFDHAGVSDEASDTYKPQRCSCEDGTGHQKYCSELDLYSGKEAFEMSAHVAM